MDAGSVRQRGARAPGGPAAKIAAVLAAIGEASSPEALAGLHRALDALAARRFEADPSVPELQALCTGYRDHIFRRALALAEAELGPPPCPYAAACVGSEGRREQTLATDQDNLLVFRDSAHRPYFLRFGAIVGQFLARAGIAPCTGGIMMGEEAWQGTVAQWKARIDRTVAFDDAGVPQHRQLLRLIILSDVRFLHGTELLVAEVASHLFARLRDNVPALYEMARASVTLPLGLGWFGRLRTERRGPNRSLLDLKRLGWAPLVLAVRVLALKHGISQTHTVDRICALRSRGRIGEELAANLLSAHELLTRLKVACELRAGGRGAHVVCFLDAQRLPPAEAKALRASLRTVGALQRLAYRSFQLP
ncbi:MAG: DUF294 nucleotidyltransferase-like domain-containing protein [Thermodesulfobacteriota bacterium]